MSKTPQLQHSLPKTPQWVTDLTKKRRSNSTSIILVESGDDGRFRELVEWLKNRCHACGKATRPIIEENSHGQPTLLATCLDEGCGGKQPGHLVFPDLTETIHLSTTGVKRQAKVHAEDIIVLTPFIGLRSIVKDDEHRLVEQPIRNPYWSGGNETSMPVKLIDEQLRLIHEHIRKTAEPEPAEEAEPGAAPRRDPPVREKEEPARRTVVVVKWPYSKDDERLEAAAHLSETILDLATDELVLSTTRSTIIIFVEDRACLKANAVSASHIVVPPRSTLAERSRIIESSVHAHNQLARVLKMRLLPVSPEETTHVAEILGGLNLDQTQMAVRECLHTRHTLDLSFLSSVKATILSNAGQVKLSEKPPVGFDAIGGYTYLKDAIRRRVILPTRHPSVVEHFGGSFKPSRGILLVGPPGTGKSLFGNATAHELDLGVVELQPDTFLDKFVGESEKRTRQVLNLIRAAEPVVVWLDEVEAVFRHRGKTLSTDGGVGRNILGMLLAALDDPRHDRRSIWVMATNRIRDVDPAVLRPGRIDDVFYVGYPDQEAREAIFRVHLMVRNKPPLEPDIDVKRLAEQTLMWSGAEIEDAVRSAIRIAGEEFVETGKPVRLGMKHLLAALRRDVNPLVRIAEEEALLEEVSPYVSDKAHIDVYRQGLNELKARLGVPDAGAAAAPRAPTPRPDWLAPQPSPPATS